MGRWAKGAERVAALIEARHLQRVVGDPDTLSALLASARRHVASAQVTAEDDPEAAYSLAYDAARKAATALLNHQGLRPTTAGGHLAIVDTINAQFPGVPGLASLDRLRRRRNQAEYPDPRSYDAARRLDPALLVLAWAVQRAKSGGPLGLDSAAVRSRIVATDRPLLRLGLARIHFDLGPVRSPPATRPPSTCLPPCREQVLRIRRARLVSPHYLVNGLSAAS